MKVKKKNVIFLCQISDGILKLIKCIQDDAAKKKFVGLEVEALPPDDTGDKKLPERLNQILKKLGYNSERIVVSLPRSQATCRYLKVPSTLPGEIENIVNLQASRYLPYQASELITGYQIVSTDKEGYSDINLIIVHRDLIERYLKIFKEFKPKGIAITLSSYGLVNLYNYVNTQEAGVVMIVDIDSFQAELVIISDKKLIFSRAFKINQNEPKWKELFIEEINRSTDAYSKDVSNKKINKIIVCDKNNNSQDLTEALNKRLNLPVEILSYVQRLNLAEDLSKNISGAGTSLASLLGLGIQELPDSLNLLPQDLKRENRRASGRRGKIRLFAFMVIILCIFTLGLIKSLDNKSQYLGKLKSELNKVSKEAKPLEEFQVRLAVMQKRSQKKLSSLDMVYELHRIMPNQVSLINLDYEEDGPVVLRGQAAELESVFTFVSQLEKSAVFKGFNVKVRYATKRSTTSGEIMDFEILCLRK